MGNLLKGIQTAILKKDTRSLCGTKHTVRAEVTGPTAGKDTILVSYKLESTSGWLKTDYHTGDGYLHKIRITIFKDGKIAYQQDVAGDDSGKFIKLPPFLITNEGKWEITAKSIAAGDCAKPTGEKNFGYLYAKQPEPVEEDNQETTVNPNDLTPILSVGMIGFAGLVFSKILRRKRSKGAETFEAQGKLDMEKIIYDLFYGDEEQQRPQREYTKQNYTIWFPINMIFSEDNAKKADLFFKRRVIFTLNNGQSFGGVTIHGKVFPIMSFDSKRGFYITTEKRFQEFLETGVVSSNGEKKEKMNFAEKTMMQKGYYIKVRKVLNNRGLKFRDTHGQYAQMMLALNRIRQNFSRKFLSQRDVGWLKTLLLARGLSTSGTTRNLIDRLFENQKPRKKIYE